MLQKLILPLLLVTVCAQQLSATPNEIEQKIQQIPSPESLLVAPQDTKPLVVQTSFYLKDINEINDEAETFQFTGILTLSWLDKRQAFDPNEAGVQEKVYQGDFQFNELSPAWYPQILLANEAGGVETSVVILKIEPDGKTTLIQNISATAKVILDMRKFPFDKHQLEAVFEIFGFDSGEVILKAMPLKNNLSVENLRLSQWSFEKIEVLTRENNAPYLKNDIAASQFIVSLEAKRLPFFVVRLVIFPLILMVVLSWSVFWMERSSLGDRINVSFIGILTAVAYQILLSDVLPHISYFTLLNGIVNLSLLTMCATVLTNLVVGSCDKKGNLKRGDIIDFRCRWIFPLVYFGLISLMTVIAFTFF